MCEYIIQGVLWRLYDSGRCFAGGVPADPYFLWEALRAERLAAQFGGVAA